MRKHKRNIIASVKLNHVHKAVCVEISSTTCINFHNRYILNSVASQMLYIFAYFLSHFSVYSILWLNKNKWSAKVVACVIGTNFCTILIIVSKREIIIIINARLVISGVIDCLASEFITISIYYCPYLKTRGCASTQVPLLRKTSL